MVNVVNFVLVRLMTWQLEKLLKNINLKKYKYLKFKIQQKYKIIKKNLQNIIKHVIASHV